MSIAIVAVVSRSVDPKDHLGSHLYGSIKGTRANLFLFCAHDLLFRL